MGSAEKIAMRTLLGLIEGETTKILKKEGYSRDFIAGAIYGFIMVKRALDRDEVMEIYDDYLKEAKEALKEEI